MGLNLAAGGHLTHGSPVNLSGKWFKPVPYNVRRDDQRIDMEEVAAARQGAQAEADHRRRLGLSAHHRFQALPRDRDEVGAYLMVDMAHFAGLVAGGAHPSPFPHAHVVTTTTHKTLRGPRGGVDPHRRRGTGQEDQLGRVPRPAGRPADACDRRQGGGLRRGAAAERSSVYAKNVVENAKALAETLKSQRPRHRLRRHRHASDAGRSAAEEADRQGGGGGAWAAPTSPATRTASRSTRRSRR